ncbi:hypothetical protein Golomagni_07957, partial [Golovinomyces magnicellulatus]
SIAAIPTGYESRQVNPYATSLWTQTFQIICKSNTGDNSSFFLKTAQGHLAEQMFHGEYEGMSKIHETVPDFAPRPVAWGKCDNSPNKFFFLSEYIKMTQQNLADPRKFCSSLAHLHKNATSPNGMFGFPMTTCNGNIPQDNTWQESWETFFANGLRHMLQLDIEKNGQQSDLVVAIQPIFETVIPRLLRPLQQGPNPIRPSLLHGDLWYGNTSTNCQTGEPLLFDSAAFYGHNEYELGNWRPVRNRFGPEFFQEYLKHYPAASPVEEFDDRIRLYELRFNFHLSIMFPGSEQNKKEMIESMKYLSNKYCSSQ